MISIITCINSQEIYEKYLLKSLKEANNYLISLNLEELNIISVYGKDYISLVHAYNDAQKMLDIQLKFLFMKIYMENNIFLLKSLFLLKKSTN